jgi:hypothetical protein
LKSLDIPGITISDPRKFRFKNPQLKAIQFISIPPIPPDSSDPAGN